MNYGIYWRPKQPRNQYGYVNNGNTSVYSSNSLYGNNISPVGGDMIDVSQLSVFVGATDDTDGIAGIVPAPMRGEQNWYYLRGNGAWDYIPAAKWLYEWPKDLEPSGLGIDGNFHVSDTLSTLNLNVEGRAHFWELVIDKAKANGGQIMVSPSLFQIDYVEKTVTYQTNNHTDEVFKNIWKYRPDITKWLTRYQLNRCRAKRVWMNNDDGMDRIFAEVEVGDMMRCRTFNLDGHAGFEGQVMKDVSNTDYWTFVCGVGNGTYTKTIQTEEGEEQREFDGIYMDLAFALTGNNSEYSYVPINTLFYDTDEGGYDILIPESFVVPDIYDELKQWTFNTLCGSTDIEEEFVEDEDTVDWIIDYDFRIRGVTYMLAAILGAEYVDDSYASLWSLYKGADVTGYILFGSDSDNIEGAVQKILGVDADPYGPLAGFEMNYAEDIVPEIADGNTGFEYSEDGQYDPQFTYDVQKASERREWMFGYGVFEPREGQQLACLGHLYDTDRQNAIVISSIQPIDPELVSPSIAQYAGIDIFGTSISQFRLSVLAKNGNILTGKFMVKNNGAYISVDEMIDLYITDIETGLETVGIHLDGENSTITMKGSVELHQHNDKDDDTLSVWNAANVKKVEIVPTQIPNRNEINQTTETPFSNNKTTSFRATNSNSDIRKQQRWYNSNTGNEGSGWMPGRHRVWRWYIDGCGLTITDRISIGTFTNRDTVDVSGINMQISLGNARLQGYYNVPLYTGNRGGSQAISYTLMLYCGSTFVQRGDWSPDNLPLNAQDFNVQIGNWIDEFHPVLNGEYFLEMSVSFSTWTNNNSYRTETEYSSPYFDLNISSRLSANTIVTSETNNFMTIGTNGLVYSVGNGDYFYAGNDGFEYKYKDNRIVMANNEFKIMHKPQIITRDDTYANKTIKSEIVYCQPSGDNSYYIYMPQNLESGRRIVIFGFNGLRIMSNADKRFKIYRHDLLTYGTYNTITLSTSTSGADSSDVYINTSGKVELVTMDDGIYVLTTIF